MIETATDLAEQQLHEALDHEWIDNAFRTEKCRFMWRTIRKDNPTEGFIYGIDEKHVIDMTRWYLKHEQEGDLDKYTRVVASAFVGGKL